MFKIHFVGIGGAGMAPLAKIAIEQGYKVTGSDRELNAKIVALQNLEANINIGHDANFMPDDTQLLVYSSAVTIENTERQKALKLNIPQERRGEFLARLTKHYKRCVAISGSHGKTSITSTLVHILKTCGVECGYLIGGVVPHISSGESGNGDIFITEADESDGTHTALTPYLGIVPNADDDHCWSVGGAEALADNFHKFAYQSQKLIYFSDCVAENWFTKHPNATNYTLQDITELNTLHGYQRRNAFLAWQAAIILGVNSQEALAAINTFPGVARRMTVHYQSEKITVIEDYAHHPTELANSIEFLRSKYPNCHLRLLFQPHRYARLALYFDRFAEELAQADSIFIVPVFAAWTESGKCGSAELVTAIGPKATLLDDNWSEVATTITKYHGEKPLLLAIIGAGDIEKVIKKLKF